MIITRAEIKNFGKLHNRIIDLSPGLNLVYGENESGKSTLHRFLAGMLFGMEKQRGRLKNDNYQRYEPWEGPAFYEGALDFAVDGRQFRLERNFYHKEKSVRLFNLMDGEELSVEQGDLTMLLGGMSRQVFENTCCVSQAAVETDKDFAGELKNYLVNVSHGGEGEFDLARAQKRLRDRIFQAKKKKKELEQKRIERMDRLRWEYDRMNRDRDELELKIEQKAWEEYEAHNQAAVAQEKRAEQQEYDIYTEGERPESAQKKPGGAEAVQKKKNNPAGSLAGGLAGGIVILSWHFIWQKVLNLPKNPWLGVEILLWGAWLMWIFLQLRHYTAALLHKDDKEEDLEVIFTAPNLYQEPENSQLSVWREQLEDKRLRLLNLEEVLTEAAGMEPAELEAGKELEGLELALSTMEHVAAELYEDSRDGLYACVSEVLSQLTAGAYDQVELSEDMELVLYSGSRRLEPWQLSRGAMEQLYLALRLGAGRKLAGDETMPILLDETFCAYDDVRLERTLLWLARQEEQVILFTCQKREQEIMERAGTKYHNILL